MDTNLVIPVSHNKTLIAYEYFFEPHVVNDKALVEKSIAASIRNLKYQPTSRLLLNMRGWDSWGFSLWCRNKFRPHYRRSNLSDGRILLTAGGFYFSVIFGPFRLPRRKN